MDRKLCHVSVTLAHLSRSCRGALCLPSLACQTVVLTSDLLHAMQVLAVVGILQDEADPMVSVMKASLTVPPQSWHRCASAILCMMWECIVPVLATACLACVVRYIVDVQHPRAPNRFTRIVYGYRAFCMGQDVLCIVLISGHPPHALLWEAQMHVFNFICLLHRLRRRHWSRMQMWAAWSSRSPRSRRLSSSR